MQRFTYLFVDMTIKSHHLLQRLRRPLDVRDTLKRQLGASSSPALAQLHVVGGKCTSMLGAYCVHTYPQLGHLTCEMSHVGLLDRDSGEILGDISAHTISRVINTLQGRKVYVDFH